MSQKPKLDCILLIDDDKATNFINEIIIRKSGVKTHIEVCNTAQRGLDFLSSKGDFSHQIGYPQPGIIFLDINMPGMNGWEFLEEYEKLPENQKAKIVVAMLTTSINPEDRFRSGANENVQAFISKPLTKEYLHQIIEANFDWESVDD